MVDERGAQARTHGAGVTGAIECRYYGRDFTAGEMALLRALIAGPPPLNRHMLSKEFCRRIGWFKPDGGLKDMMARVAMLAMHRDGLIALPAPQGRQNRPGPIVFGPDTEAPLFPAPTTLDEVRPLDEAKALGVKMAQPAFQAKDLIERHGIAVISGNLQFYTDMSNRVMQVFGELVPAVEKYSIDECFLDLTGIPQDLTAFCQDLKRTVRQWTGLPVSIGIAETKTLAKIANRLAKTSANTDGVLDLTGTRWRDKALASTEVSDVWGIGRQYAQKLNRNGVMTALDLTRRPDGWIRKEMGVGGLKTVRELRGEDCIGFDDMPQPKQTTMVSRSFGTEVRGYDALANAIALFATDAARSIRKANLVASSVSVFIETNRYGAMHVHHLEVFHQAQNLDIFTFAGLAHASFQKPVQGGKFHAQVPAF